MVPILGTGAGTGLASRKIKASLDCAGVRCSVICDLETEKFIKAASASRFPVVMRIRPLSVSSKRYLISALSRFIAATPGGVCA